MRYYKILNEKEKHNDLQYQTGMNVDPVPFNADPEDSCVKGGIYFSDVENILAFVSYGPWIREVTIPEGAQMIKDPGNGPTKYRADKIILGERRKWKDVEVLKELVGKGANLHINQEEVLCEAAGRGYLETIQYLVEQGTDIHICSGYALRWAAANGRLEVVRYLVEKHKINIAFCNNEALQLSVENGHLEVVKYIVEQGASKADLGWSLGWAAQKAAQKGHLEVVKYLVEHGADKSALLWSRQ